MEYSYNDFVTDVKMGREIKFTHRNNTYFVTYDNRGIILINVSNKTKQIFKNDDELLSNALINSKRILQIWDDISVDTIY